MLLEKRRFFQFYLFLFSGRWEESSIIRVYIIGTKKAGASFRLRRAFSRREADLEDAASFFCP
jgi:hypothetical protein